jgi:hypothetical protein
MEGMVSIPEIIGVIWVITMIGWLAGKVAVVVLERRRLDSKLGDDFYRRPWK